MNTPGRNARSVAEFTVGMITAEMRNIARSHDALRDKYWRKDSPNHQAIPELGGKVVGLVGLGHIAQLVAGFLSGFGTEIIFYDKYVAGHERYESRFSGRTGTTRRRYLVTCSPDAGNRKSD